jgi:hypothetical protein
LKENDHETIDDRVESGEERDGDEVGEWVWGEL